MTEERKGVGSGENVQNLGVIKQPDATDAWLADAVEHIRWRLWHGQAQRALDLIGDTLAELDASAVASWLAAAAAGEVVGVLRGLETYVARQAALIIDSATARHGDEPISTVPTEGTVQWLLHRRMGANQQMRWSPRGAHLMVKVRTAVANDTFDRDLRDNFLARLSASAAPGGQPSRTSARMERLRASIAQGMSLSSISNCGVWWPEGRSEPITA